MAFTVLFQGDSITDCGRNNCGGAGYTNNGLGPGYPSLIASRLQCDYPAKDIAFINKGISGNRIVDLYARWRIDGLNLNPDIISILIGVNDTWHEFGNHNGVDVPRYARFYRELLEWSKSTLPNVKFVLLEPFVAPGLVGKPEFVAEVAERAKVVKGLADEFGAIFLPLQGIFNDAFKRAPENHWTPDGVHPTPAGHQLITDAWLKATADMFAKL